jgi:hypothetical protein
MLLQMMARGDSLERHTAGLAYFRQFLGLASSVIAKLKAVASLK